DNLGSGSRWTEIYNLNSEIIGNNPNLICSGYELHLPGSAGEHLASAGHEYVVRSGDNLWNIARDHTGAGANWPSIYAENSNVIGANPDLIHPGQN
ncbi:MAG TPA: LysM peptidoglycan-binding domain-containing protein, partial [Candidatus Melainabacteria bacterium]|nr:LysM peptidoglycan-binding domain-containing protein [Candidatus Melainabacteria bacterium]